MPKVTTKIRKAALAVSLIVAAFGPSRALSEQYKAADKAPNSAATLYEQLRTVGLDAARVYKIREASLDRKSLHISLNDGTIAFTQNVAGRITGAFFEGDGEVLLSPPDHVEQSSMALFTGAAILEEGFSTAYLRFNDDTFKELMPFLRPQENSETFIAQWNDAAKSLAAEDAMRLLITFSPFLPVSDSDRENGSAPPARLNDSNAGDRMLHLRVQGRKLGVFDLFFDLTAREQISAGQVKNIDGNSNYDVWTSFAVKFAGIDSAAGEIAGDAEETGEIEIPRYDISTDIKPPAELDAEARLQIVVRRSGARAVLFELSRYLKVRQVEADGRPLEFIHNPALEGTQLERRGDDLVAVIFPSPLRAGQQIELHFSYGGNVLSEAGGGLIYVGARGTWYPNRGLAKATFNLQFSYPPEWTLVATGTRVDVPASSEATSHSVLGTHPLQVRRWISDTAIPVAGFNLGKFSQAASRSGTVDVDVYAASAMERSFPHADQVGVLPLLPPVLPGQPQVRTTFGPPAPSPKKNAQQVADDAAEAISFFSAQFGAYPYKSLAVTQMPGPLSQGWPGLIFLSSFAFLSSQQKSAIHMSDVERSLSDSVIAHEIAHQWWGDLVCWSTYRDQWISEALANYSSLLLLESKHPSQFRAIMEKYRNDLLEKNSDGLRYMDAGPVTLGARLSSSKFPNGYETIAYERGTWLLHMLRTFMRDSSQAGARAHSKTSSEEPFISALRELRERYQSHAVSTAELMQVFEEHSAPSSVGADGKPLNWFYQAWINGTAIPSLELRGVKYIARTNATFVTGVIHQKDAPEDLVTSVPAYAVLHGKNVFIGRIFADGQEAPFHLTAPAGTRRIVLDPEHTVLSR